MDKIKSDLLTIINRIGTTEVLSFNDLYVRTNIFLITITAQTIQIIIQSVIPKKQIKILIQTNQMKLLQISRI